MSYRITSLLVCFLVSYEIRVKV